MKILETYRCRKLDGPSVALCYCFHASVSLCLTVRGVGRGMHMQRAKCSRMQFSPEFLENTVRIESWRFKVGQILVKSRGSPIWNCAGKSWCFHHCRKLLDIWEKVDLPIPRGKGQMKMHPRRYTVVFWPFTLKDVGWIQTQSQWGSLLLLQ